MGMTDTSSAGLIWDGDSTQEPLRISNEGTRLSWEPPPETSLQPSSSDRPVWLVSQTTGRLTAGHFSWDFFIDSLEQRQMGIGILIAPPDWGFFGYLGAGHNAFAYDPYQGAIVTETVAVYSGLPKITSVGTVSIELDLLEQDTCTFIVNGERTPSIPLPPGCTVIPAACLLEPGQCVSLRGFQIKRLGAGASPQSPVRDARFRTANALLRERIAAQSPKNLREDADSRYRQALEECQGKLQRSPDDIALLSQRARLLYALRERDEPEVLEAYEAVLRVNPRDWEAWRRRAHCLSRLERYEDEIECWDHLLAGLPDSELPRDDLPFVIRSCIADGLVASRGDAYYWSEKAASLEKLGRLAESVQCFREAVSLAPENYWFLKQMGDVLESSQELEEAIVVYDRVLLANPQFLHARFQKGLCLTRLERYRQALEALSEAAGQSMLDPDTLIPYVMFKMGDVEGATRALHDLVAAHPYSHPLEDNHRTLHGIEVEDDYVTLATAVYTHYADRRQTMDS